MPGNVPIYVDQGGANMYVDSGGSLTILPGGTFNDGGTFVPPVNFAITNATVSGTLTGLNGSNIVATTGAAVALNGNATLGVTGTAAVTLGGTATLEAKTGTTVTVDAGAVLALAGALNLTGATVYNSTQMYVSAPRTATGSAESFAHGLGGTPAVFFMALNTTDAGIIAGGYVITPGATDGTDIKVTATANLVYQAVAVLITAAP